MYELNFDSSQWLPVEEAVEIVLSQLINVSRVNWDEENLHVFVGSNNVMPLIVDVIKGYVKRSDLKERMKHAQDEFTQERTFGDL